MDSSLPLDPPAIALSKDVKGKGRAQAERSESEEASDEDISDPLEVPDDDGSPSTQYDPGEDEAETAVEDIYALWEARTTARNAKLANWLHSSKVDFEQVSPIPPDLSVCRKVDDMMVLLIILKDRIVSVAWNGGRMGFTTDKKLLQDNAEWFIEKYLANKSVRELKIIESFPEAHITPTLVLESGLVTKRVSSEDQVIYFKTIMGSARTTRKVASSPRPFTAGRGQALAAFLNGSPSSPHIKDLRLHDRDPQSPYPFHSGRLSRGLTARHFHERREGQAFDPTKGSRHRAESVAYGGGHEEVEYWLLGGADGLEEVD